MKFDQPPKKEDNQKDTNIGKKILAIGMGLSSVIATEGKTLDNSLDNNPIGIKKNLEKKDLERDSLIKEYGEIMADRWSDFKILSKKTESGKTYRQIFNEIGEEYGIPSEVLFASTAEEGLRDYIRSPFDTKDKVYKVSGFENFGLDRFAENFPLLVKKGLLEKDFDFKESIHKNEKGTSVKSADFKSVEDAIRAKAANMVYVSDKVVEFADKNNISISDNALDFFMLVAYNAGLTNALNMLNEYNSIGVLENDAFLKNRPTKGNDKIILKENSWEQPYTYAMRRMVPANAWRDKELLRESKIKKLGPDYAKKENTVGLPGSNIGNSK